MQEVNFTMKKILNTAVVLAVSMLFLWSNGHAQNKIRYLNSQTILDNLPEAKEIQKRLDEIRSGYESEYTQKLQQYEGLAKEIESQSLLLSPEKKSEKERSLQALRQEIEQYQVDKLGPQGEFYKKNIELTKPLYDKIDAVIQRISEEEDYDFVLDVVQGVLVFAKPEFDITNRIIEELKKGS